MPETQIDGEQILDHSIELGVDTSGALPTDQGGTGLSVVTPNSILITGEASNTPFRSFPLGPSGTIITSNGEEQLPGFIANSINNFNLLLSNSLDLLFNNDLEIIEHG